MVRTLDVIGSQKLSHTYERDGLRGCQEIPGNTKVLEEAAMSRYYQMLDIFWIGVVLWLYSW